MRTKVAVVQMCSIPDLAKNLSAAERLVREAAADGAKLVMLPECFAFLGPEQEKLALAETLPAGGPVLARCVAWAKELGVELVLGGFWEKGSAPGKVRNACVHVAADGSVKSIYRKIHLFDVDLPDGTQLTESSTVEAGETPVTTDASFGKLGLSVCYDVRFPELYRKLVDQGAIALAIPAAFTATTGKDHWHVLLRARAIESQCYVLAAAQTGKHFGSRASYGHALIVDPWGVVLAECGEGEGFAAAFIDDEVVTRIRQSLPSLKHRRL
ncbi:MAG: carbon-nitrogen hydrolase family protein [Sandaracinaceae bacterium]|nr:carbon-nitrogen hydrolase family protein [Sandaracinaceae bacterium]